MKLLLPKPLLHYWDMQAAAAAKAVAKASEPLEAAAEKGEAACEELLAPHAAPKAIFTSQAPTAAGTARRWTTRTAGKRNSRRRGRR